MSPNWNMGEVLGPRIRALVPYRTDLANHIHFARLFQSQLIAMCKGDVSLKSSDDDDNIALLSQLKRSNPEKFKRLQERFIKPLSHGGPCPLPTFLGCQEFFRDFIVLACNPVLNQHLCDTFSAKVLELNETTFTLTDDDDGVQANEDEEESKLFSSVLLDSRLVAKFLGFVTFLPYQSLDKLPDSVESTYIAIRTKQLPLLDIQHCLRLSVVHGKLCLTVPWLVEYLSMMDNLAPSLEYFKQVLYLLLYVHRYVWRQLQEEITYTSLMIVALISWLLENPVFPEGFFFSDISEDISAQFQDQFQDQLPSLAALDNRNLVNQGLFYTCCPYVGELKSLLVDFTVGYGNKASAIRKITPISADVPVKKPLNERQLQLQMEENFFHNHPASMKRVVDFAADRTASNFIKKFRAGLLHESLTEGKETVLKQLLTQSEGSPSSKIKDKIYQVTSRVAQDLQARVRQSVAADIPGYCSSRIESLMKLLLPDDQDDTVVAMATQISLRVAEEKITQWMNKHITVAMYQTEMTPELDKVNKLISKSQSVSQSSSQSDLQILESRTMDVIGTQTSETVAMATTHLDKLPHPSEILIDLKDSVKALVLGSKTLSPEKVLELIRAVKFSLECRQDILAGVYRSFGQLTIELLISLMLNQPTSYTSDVVDAFLSLWKGPLVNYNLSYLISGRVVFMVQNSASCTEAWKHYQKLLTRLWNDELLKPVQIEDCFLQIVTNMQEEETFTHLSECVCHMADLMGESKGEDMGTCLELLFQKLSGDITPTELTGDSTLTEPDKEMEDCTHRKEENGGKESHVEGEKTKPDKTVIELERLLKTLGLTNNNKINPFEQDSAIMQGKL